MAAYYNENDAYAAEWLRNLIKADLIAPGHVDERSIADVKSEDLEGFTQCHFFAGIGVWSHALRCAGWPDGRPVWTGSCPCQPFSGAGKKKGKDDERHLWPVWFDLIRERRPGVILGEQVASKDGYAWFDDVQANMEGLDYPCGAIVTPAAGYGAPEERHRIYWMADASGEELEKRIRNGRIQSRAVGSSARQAAVRSDNARGVADSDGRHASAERQQRSRQHGQQPQDGCIAGGLGNPTSQRYGARDVESVAGRRECAARPADGACASGESATGPLNGIWRNADWLFCRDGKWRPVEPGTFPLAHGIANRVGQLRAYGNAVVAPQATEFVEAVIDVMEKCDHDQVERSSQPSGAS